MRWILNVLSEQNGHNFYFICQAGCNFSMRRARGRYFFGQSAFITVDRIRSCNISLCAVMSNNGIIHHETQIGAYNSSHFSEFLENFVNVLDLRGKKIIIMVMVMFHSFAHWRNWEKCKRGDIGLCFSPLQPIFESNERVFAKWKAFVKSTRFCNESDLTSAITSATTKISPQNCLN